MTTTAALPPEFTDILARVFDGELASGEWEQLTEVLRQNNNARNLYRDFVKVHAVLRWELAPPIPPEFFTTVEAAPVSNKPPVLGAGKGVRYEWHC